MLFVQAVEGQVAAGWGKFCCLVAVQKLPLPPAPSETLRSSAASFQMLPWLKVFVPEPYKVILYLSRTNRCCYLMLCTDSLMQRHRQALT